MRSPLRGIGKRGRTLFYHTVERLPGVEGDGGVFHFHEKQGGARNVRMSRLTIGENMVIPCRFFQQARPVLVQGRPALPRLLPHGG